MKTINKRRIHSLNRFLEQPVIIVATVVALFIYYGISNHALLVKTNQNTASTQNVVKSQTDILNAIKQLATDTKVDSNEKTNIIICMLQVPVAQRTTDLQQQCRDQVEANQANGTVQIVAPNSSSAPAKPTSSAGAGSVPASPAKKTPADTGNGNNNGSSGTSKGNPVTNTFDRFVYRPVTNFLKTALGVQ